MHVTGANTSDPSLDHGPRPSEPPPRASTWTVVVQAQGSGPLAERALSELIKRYQSAVIALVRAFGYPWNLTPEDLKQEFFLHLIRRGDIHKLDRTRGRFRDWLRVAVENFMKNEWASWHAAKYGQRLTAPHSFQALHGVTPELVFMRQFAEDTLLLALERHREQDPDKARFDRFVRFLPAPDLELAELAELAAQLGESHNCVAVQVCRMRQRHRAILQDLVSDTLDLDATDPGFAQAIACEMGQLYRLLCEVPRTQVLLEDA